MVLGLKLKIEEATSKGLKHVLVSLDLKNSNNAFNRREAHEALETPARDRSIAPPAQLSQRYRRPLPEDAELTKTGLT